MHVNEMGTIRWLSFPLLDEAGLLHGVFQRHGGHSHGPYTSLNIGLGLGDEETLVHANIAAVSKALKTPVITAMQQRHTANVQQITKASPPIIPTCDGLVTQTIGIGLLSRHADCQAALFYDPIAKVLANIHSGWRGSVQNIYAVTIGKMRSLGCKTENILVGISPSLGPQHAEFKNYKDELPKTFWPHQPRPTYFDFWAISRKQLEQCGILPQHIEIAGICTYGNEEDWFSHRRDKTTGRHATLAVLH